MVLMMITGAVMIFFTGFVHVWSVYVPYVIHATHWPQSSVTMAFYLSNCFFVAGNILGGKLHGRIGARKALVLGGALNTAGVLLAGVSLRYNPFLLYLTYGAMMGIGEGFVYTVILDTAQKWFPTRTGFASGIIVTSGGLTGLILAPVSRALLSSKGPAAALTVVGLMVGAAWILSSIFFALPRDAAGDNQKNIVSAKKQYTPEQMLRSGKYYLLLAGFFFALLPYYLISPVSQTFQTEHGLSEATAVSAVMIGAMVNAGFRLILPTLADRIGRFACLFITLAVSVLSMLFLALGSGSLLPIGVILAYGCFGGVMGNFPSLTSMIFGLKHAGVNYSFVMIGMILSALSAPLMTNLLQGIGMTGGALFFFGAGAAGIALVLLARLKNGQ